MLSTIFIHIVVSFVMIIAIHYLFDYLKNNFTQKKTRDLIGSRHEKYKTVLEDLEKTLHLCTFDKGMPLETSRVARGNPLETPPFREPEKNDIVFLENDLDQFITSLTTTQINL
jgi:hypothetical protein